MKYMRQEAIKWWKSLPDKNKQALIKEWKNSSGSKEDEQFKQWPENLIMLSSSIIEKIYAYNILKSKL